MVSRPIVSAAAEDIVGPHCQITRLPHELVERLLNSLQFAVAHGTYCGQDILTQYNLLGCMLDARRWQERPEETGNQRIVHLQNEVSNLQDELGKCRAAILATGITENEGSLLSLVTLVCDVIRAAAPSAGDAAIH